MQEGSSAANVGRLYVHGNRVDEIVASLTAGAWNYHHYDARGHCILLTGPTGSVIEQYEYDAFGKPYFYNAGGGSLPNGSSYGNRFLFTGREWLSDLKLYDYRNRMYQPELGRFLQPDPKQFAAGDYNLYRYCHNDPINHNDPTGLDPVLVSPEANAWALQADLGNLAQMNANTWVFGLLAFEYGTTVYQDSQGKLFLSEPRTDHAPRSVRPAEDPRFTSVVETHSHPIFARDDTTHSTLSVPDVQRGNQTGRTQEVISPNGTRDRYRPSDNAAERKRGEGGIIERLNSQNKWERLKGANTNLKNRGDARNGY